ncbi:P-loop containing nucleoside triphosphate hydrolase protein [Mycena galopus ATCC 62051]|nr:P-loop containing nucleoside triphosphate hydrolase protein [Mycena galopus ATCC 62051]
MDEWDVVLLGDGGVGKTALVSQASNSIQTASSDIPQFALNCWVETYDPTIEDGFRRQFLVDNRMCFLKVIDTAGQEEYAFVRNQWIRESQGFILVYSIASRSTFDRLEVFRQAIKRNRRRGGEPIMVLLGNKCDKSYEREVSIKEGAALAKEFGCEFFETSAKTAQNVELAFGALVRALRIVRNPQSYTY